MNENDIFNDIFRALADPTRRMIFEKLASGSMNASALRAGMEISQPAMSQHLAVLRGAGLVREEREGRFVNYEVDPNGLTLIANWLAKYRAYWPERIDALKTLLKDISYRMRESEPPFLESMVTFRIVPGVSGGTFLRVIHELNDTRLKHTAVVAANSNRMPMMRAA